MVESVRNRQVKNFLTATTLSLGLPMILLGDEVRRTQRGNNNAYCQDNETSWFDWGLIDKHADVLPSSRPVFRLRKSRQRRPGGENGIVHGVPVGSAARLMACESGILSLWDR